MSVVELVERHELARPDDQVTRATAGWLLSFASEHTRRAYRADLQRWGQFCADHDIDPLAATRGHVDAWARLMQQDGAAPRTVARRIAAMASWYGYLTDEGVIASSPVEHVRRPPISQDGETPGLNREELRRLLAAAEGSLTPAGRRNHALLILLAYTGLRINEALSRDVEDLSYNRGHRTMQITRKGGTTARTVLSPPVAAAVDEYLAGRTTGPIFLTATGKRMKQPEAWRVIRRLAHRAGLESAGALSPHSLRVAFITGAREAGVPLEDVQDAAGHADPRTTRRYDRGRHSLDRHATYALTAWLATDGGESSP